MGNEKQHPNKDKTENTQNKYQLQSLQKQAGALEKKESEIKEKQQKLNNQQQLLQKREEALAKDKELLNIKSLKLETRHQQQESKHLEIEQGLPALRDKVFAEREQQLAEQQQLLKQQLRDVAAKKQQMQAEREQLEKVQETVDGDFSEQRADLQRELQQKRSEAITKLHNEVQQQREKDFKDLEVEVQQRRDDLEQRELQLEQQQVTLTGDQNNVRFQQSENKQLKTSLEQIIAERTKTREEEFVQDQKQFEQEKQRLLSRIKHQDALHSAYDELEKALGDRSADEVLRDLTVKNEELIALREELKRPSQELEEYYDGHRAVVTRLEEDKQKLQNENRELQHDLDTQEQLEFDQERLQTKFNSLDVNYKAILADNNKLQETLDRLNPAYNEPQNREERIRDIKRPYIESFVPRRQEKSIDELKWLEAISSGIDKHGLHFSPRILCAFHTALKIAEWSPLTVLAGVSGTGKSELPKLYSRFGGINFINVPVQPNWDSQEAMLGYFNSISNSYQTKPMLNFLVQSREKLITGSDNSEANYNGLDDTVSLVLLDEMNLAHVELYFADFLSKLEQRRATKNDELPFIDIDLGAKLDPYKLSLGRNLLFAGTMNQDETTKSLSDKVIDRGTSIFFPRPETLHRREKLTPLPEQSPLLPMKIWWGWINKKSDLNDAAVSHYKQVIEGINKYLGTDGRALGHRVWQSIEYYMVNHPLVIGLDAEQYPDEYKDALKFAFEDQLVQKVMPKLRGIETRGYAKEHCLNPIRDLLADNKLDILDDFDKAMRIGHGQFSWASADYLNDEQSNERYQELFKLALEPSPHQKKVIKPGPDSVPEPDTSVDKILAHRVVKQPNKTHESKMAKSKMPKSFKTKPKGND